MSTNICWDGWKKLPLSEWKHIWIFLKLMITAVHLDCALNCHTFASFTVAISKCIRLISTKLKSRTKAIICSICPQALCTPNLTVYELQMKPEWQQTLLSATVHSVFVDAAAHCRCWFHTTFIWEQLLHLNSLGHGCLPHFVRITFSGWPVLQILHWSTH